MWVQGCKGDMRPYKAHREIYGMYQDGDIQADIRITWVAQAHVGLEEFREKQPPPLGIQPPQPVILNIPLVL